MLTHFQFLALCLLLLGCGKSRKYMDQAPMAPAESMRAMHLTEPFDVQLFASEPHVVDPVDMAFDENGRIYVAEMLDYPDDPPPTQRARSRIRILEDRDGDGIVDGSHIFADNLPQVSGLMCWKGGIIAGSAPDILFLKDNDGDGVADERRVLLTGFPKVNPEGRITNFRLGIDNWIYAANNGADAKITNPSRPHDPPLILRGADLRFRPDLNLAERASGPAQFGLTFDGWGREFITQNTVHLRQVMLPARYLARAPGLEVGAVAQDISLDGKGQTPMFPLTHPQQWRVQRTALRQERYKETNPGRQEFVGGYFSAASGSTVYTGDAFPAGYEGSVYTGDVSGNLVRREVLEPNGLPFKAVPSQQNREFLASTDVWFRPCHFANAPDGNLYLLDMYREFIETPESIPEEIRKGMNFWSGDDKGRIYRIAPKETSIHRTLKVSLGVASSKQLVLTLKEANGWHRQTAQRLLVDRKDKSIVPDLEALIVQQGNPQARLHALYTLEGMQALEPSHILKALGDKNPMVRVHALRLADGLTSRNALIDERILDMGSDPNVEVQYQLAFTLGLVHDSRVPAMLTALEQMHGSDRWFRAAILSSIANNPTKYLGAMHHSETREQLAALIGARGQAGEIEKLLGEPLSPEQMQALAHGLDLSGAPRIDSRTAEAALTGAIRGSGPLGDAAWDVARHFSMPSLVARGLADARKPGLPEAERARAVRALGAAPWARAAPVLDGVLSENPEAGVQKAAVSAISEFPETAAAALLIKHWKSYRPEARVRAQSALTGRREWLPLLLAALESGAIEPPALDVAGRARLLEADDKSIAERARAIYRDASAERTRVIASYQSAVSAKGNPEHGKKIFEDQCARCHWPRKQGWRVGPDLSGVNNKSKEELLASILNPSASIEPRFVNYIVTTSDGRMFDGVIGNETAGAIMLRGGSDEGDQTILRKNIAGVRASTISLMPEGFEKNIDAPAMADLLAFLRAQHP